MINLETLIYPCMINAVHQCCKIFGASGPRESHEELTKLGLTWKRFKPVKEQDSKRAVKGPRRGRLSLNPSLLEPYLFELAVDGE